MVRVSVFAALAIHRIVTTDPGGSQIGDRHPIMGRRVTRPTDRQWIAAGYVRSPIPAARHLLSARRPGESHQRRTVPVRDLGRGTVHLPGRSPLVPPPL